MLKVYLPRTWFVRGQRIRRSRSRQDLRLVPDEWRDRLPKEAEVITNAPPLRPDKAFLDRVDKAPDILKEADLERAAQDAVAKVVTEADAEEEARREKAERFRAELEAEERAAPRKAPKK